MQVAEATHRLHTVEAITACHTLVFAACVFIQAQRVRPPLTDPKATLRPPGDVLAEHQRWYVRQTVLHIAHLVRAGYSDARLLRELTLTQPDFALCVAMMVWTPPARTC